MSAREWLLDLSYGFAYYAVTLAVVAAGAAAVSLVLYGAGRVVNHVSSGPGCAGYALAMHVFCSCFVGLGGVVFGAVVVAALAMVLHSIAARGRKIRADE